MRGKILVGVALIPIVLAGATSFSNGTAAKPDRVNTMTITAHDFTFTAPRRIPSGLTKFHFINNGGTLHHAQLLKFAGKHTVKEYVAALKPDAPPPAWATMMGGPNAIAPHNETTVTESLAPGNYGIVCFVDVPDHVPHVMKGMSRDFTVTAHGGNSSPLPPGDLSVSLVDYAFKWSAPVTAGFHRITVTSDAAQPHEFTVIRLAPGMKASDLLTWLDKMQGPPPGEVLGGVASLAPGQPASVGMVFTPGNYMLICFVPDSKDGKPHFMHGMVQEFSIR